MMQKEPNKKYNRKKDSGNFSAKEEDENTHIK